MSNLNIIDLDEDEEYIQFPPQLIVEDEDENVKFDVAPHTESSPHVQAESPQHVLTDKLFDKLSNNRLDEPKVGMEFDSPDDLFEYYTSFARQQGFAVAKRSSRKGYVAYECNKRGIPRIKKAKRFLPRPQIKVGCNAHLTATIFPDGKWRIRVAKNDHNHEQSPGKSKYFKCNRVLDRHTKRRLELNDAAGIRQNKTIDSLQLEVGGSDNCSWISKDCRNHLDKVRRLSLGEGDAEAMQQYFLKMQADNSYFFYAMDLDEEGTLRNVFWADARSREACKEFGDVVTFDTTYLVNKYDMPFAPFVGVNHHGNSILLGCGLISHEDTESFSWLFKTWMTCMWGCAPKAIITDQCIAMKNAVEDVFPETRHRWCIWHIMKKVPEKFSAHKKYESISWCMRKAVYDTLTVEDFETAWDDFVNKYNLEENSWLQSLYLEKNRWVPAYVKDVFWAGMSSTQRSEGMNAYFDGYIHSKTTLKQFVEQYEIALKKKVEIETQEDMRSWNSYIPCLINDELEEQFQRAYTHNKVIEFQKEFSKKLQCQLGTVSGDEHVIKEWVKFGEKEEKHRVCFKVVFNSNTNEAQCNCRLFESKGMVCRHQLMVWNEMGVNRVPDKYILRRWSKNVRRAHTKIRISYAHSKEGIEAKRHDILCELYKEIVYLAEDSEERFERMLTIGHELKKEFEEALGVYDSTTVVHMDALVDKTDDVDGPLKQSAPIRDPKVIKRKGRPRSVMPINHSDKAVRSLKRKHNLKGKDKVPKKKHSNDIIEKASGTEHAVTNVDPNLIRMTQIYQSHNNPQSYKQSSQSQSSTFLNSQDWRGSQQSTLDVIGSPDFRGCEDYSRGGYLANIVDVQSPHIIAPPSQISPIFGAEQGIHLLQSHTSKVQYQHQRMPLQTGAQFPNHQSLQQGKFSLSNLWGNWR